MTYYALIWTQSNGKQAEWHYALRDEAERVAEQLRKGWRKDARVETR